MELFAKKGQEDGAIFSEFLSINNKIRDKLLSFLRMLEKKQISMTLDEFASHMLGNDDEQERIVEDEKMLA